MDKTTGDAPTTEAQYAAAVDALLRCRGDRAELENTLTQARILGGQYLARAEKAEATIARVEALVQPQWRSVLYDRTALLGDLRAVLRGPAPTDA